MTAEQVSNQLVAQIPSAKVVTVFNAETDPNKLLGRPDGYLSKTLFGDRRVLNGGHDMDQGGSVEVFADDEGAGKRGAYLQG